MSSAKSKLKFFFPALPAQLGYWIVEDLVDRKTEFYPKGGLDQLVSASSSLRHWRPAMCSRLPFLFQRRGLKQLSKAGIVAILDHHALPGVQTSQQMFTGRHTQYNYHRALMWTAVMTALSHVDPAFSNVVSIEAVNEPAMDANQTPGHGDFQKNFVLVVRAVEYLLGIPVPGLKTNAEVNSNVTVALGLAADLPPIFPTEVRSVIADATPILSKLGVQFSSPNIQAEPLVTNFMDINWQYNKPANPADAALGPQIYDNHLYYSYGGVADANENAYLTSICNLKRIETDAALRNSPLYFGEWALPTQFQASDAFLRKWADAQKRAYSRGAGWIFWNFKVEISSLAGDLARQWSYLEGVKRGYLTKDPSKLLDPRVCDSYVKSSVAAESD
ncbi:hypothetical protein H0H81_008580 [Sphagnurus paluster]|uniref:Glycoside hydrolase family 5 domain-containing protein n=1 Tax=Sphagnurus paluster TaxID=117069 RepID=A0A9P7KKU3_9AGAR|nr:hypothetical protein H0H81_008580 [Sphagnurus paluster]